MENVSQLLCQLEGKWRDLFRKVLHDNLQRFHKVLVIDDIHEVNVYLEDLVQPWADHLLSFLVHQDGGKTLSCSNPDWQFFIEDASVDAFDSVLDIRFICELDGPVLLEEITSASPEKANIILELREDVLFEHCLH
jgi:hypothetical protein